MNSLETTAKILVALGITIVIIGLFLLISSKMGVGSFRLPGDIIIKKDNFTFYFPWVTGIVISIVLSIIFNIFARR
jgi:formate hydrogenlyase subunit 3/multisubunit Na+/H+ antiporter MnhD subunit